MTFWTLNKKSKVLKRSKVEKEVFFFVELCHHSTTLLIFIDILEPIMGRTDVFPRGQSFISRVLLRFFFLMIITSCQLWTLTPIILHICTVYKLVGSCRGTQFKFTSIQEKQVILNTSI